MSLHYKLSVVEVPKVTSNLTKATTTQTEERISRAHQSSALWVDMARWFGEDIRSILDNIKTVHFHEVEEIRVRMGQPLMIRTSEQDLFLNREGKVTSPDKAYRVSREDLACTLERMTHSSVYAAMLDSYKELQAGLPHKKFVYGETGWKTGGRFRPHKTHMNGLSVDFFVPVIDENGNSVQLPSTALNKYGYSIEFDPDGIFNNYRIDFEAMAAHLLALKKAADKRGVKIWRVIFDNDLQKLLFQTSKGSELQKQLTFSKKKPWVRHDEHYHIDFIVPCK